LVQTKTFRVNIATGGLTVVAKTNLRFRNLLMLEQLLAFVVVVLFPNKAPHHKVHTCVAQRRHGIATTAGMQLCRLLHGKNPRLDGLKQPVGTQPLLLLPRWRQMQTAAKRWHTALWISSHVGTIPACSADEPMFKLLLELFVKFHLPWLGRIACIVSKLKQSVSCTELEPRNHTSFVFDLQNSFLIVRTICQPFMAF